MEKLEQNHFVQDVTYRPDFGDAQPPCPLEAVQIQDSIIPSNMAAWLRPYQVQGVAFLYALYREDRGGILGDDMGLGKTVQVIVFLTLVFGKNASSLDTYRMREARERHLTYPIVLITCPASLISNWVRELDTWGYWRIGVYHGTTKEEVYKSAKSGRCEIVITTYDTYKQNSVLLNGIEWSVVIADECQRIKNNASETTIQMRHLNSICRIGLTGTAMQNDYEELWVLLDWCNPGGIGTLASWTTKIAHPLRLGQSKDATDIQLANARKLSLQLRDNLLPKFLLRRTKLEILDQLPRKIDKVVFCQPSSTQARALQNFMNTPDMQVFLRQAELCDCGSGNVRRLCHFAETSTGDSISKIAFRALSSMRKLANHVALVLPRSEDNVRKRNGDLALLSQCLPDSWEEIVSRAPLTNYADTSFCGKWVVLEALLELWYNEGAKVLVFSYSTRLLDMLETLMLRKKYICSRLDGSMDLESRSSEVDEFNNNPGQFVFLISTRAGGVGLNIVSANKVVVFDPNFNPTHDMQAQDRAYRIGQRRDVEVFRLICAGTIEENVYARQIYKQQQANIAYSASLESRYFSGVQNSAKGELFGWNNLFTFSASNLYLKGILYENQIKEAKFRIADIMSLSDGNSSSNAVDDGTSGIRELIEMFQETANGAQEEVQEQERKSHGTDVVNAILNNVGVRYVHNNQEIVGTNQTEKKMYENALKGKKNPQVSTSSNQYSVGNVPVPIMRRHVQALAHMFYFTSITDFGRAIERADSETRKKALNIFYNWRTTRRREEMLSLKDYCNHVAQVLSVRL